MSNIDLSGLSAVELQDIITRATALLPAAAAPVSVQPMRVVIATPSYNEKRCSRPWIAKVTAWRVGGNPVLEFGGFVGREGNAGELEIMAKPGDILRRGQKDNRGKNSESLWLVVNAEGKAEAISEVEASKLFRR